MNHRMPAMIRNHRDCAWDRNIQTGTRLLSEQTVLIIGLGNIGSYCATMLAPLVKQVVGVRRSATDTNTFTINDALAEEFFTVKETLEAVKTFEDDAKSFHNEKSD